MRRGALATLSRLQSPICCLLSLDSSARAKPRIGLRATADATPRHQGKGQGQANYPTLAASETGNTKPKPSRKRSAVRGRDASPVASCVARQAEQGVMYIQPLVHAPEATHSCTYLCRIWRGWITRLSPQARIAPV